MDSNCLLEKTHCLSVESWNFNRQLAASGSKAAIRGGEHDPISLEGRNSSIADWIEDPGVLEGEDTSWMNVALPSDADDNSVGGTADDDGGTETE